MVLFALSLAGTGILFGQNPNAPDSPALIEKNNPELGYPESSDPSRGPASSESGPSPLSEGLHLTPRLGYENTIYNQAGAPSLTQTSLRANVDLNWLPAKSNFEAELRFNITGLPLETTASNISARFFGISADLGYTWIKTPFLKLRLMGGLYYTSTLVTDRSFGYPGLIFPEIYPSLTLYIFDNITLDASYRFMYLGTLFDSSRTHIVRTLGLSILLNKKHSISALLEDDGFSLVFPSSTLIQYYSLGFVVGYSF
jgi:hypothetical protein